MFDEVVSRSFGCRQVNRKGRFGLVGRAPGEICRYWYWRWQEVIMDMLGSMPLGAQQNPKTSRARLPSFLQTAPPRSLGPS